MATVTASEFAKNFGRYRERAQREPVAVTSHGRTSGYFVSPEDFREYQTLKAGARQAIRVVDLPREIIEAIRDSRVDPRHDHLNKQRDD